MNAFADSSLRSRVERAAAMFREMASIPVEVVFFASPEAELGPEASPHLCSLVRASASGRERCRLQMLRAGEQAVRLGEPYIYLCHAGLVEWVVPLVHEREVVGLAAGGRVTMWNVDTDMALELRSRLQDLPVPRQEITHACRALQQMSPDRVRQSAQLMFDLLCYVLGADMRTLEQKRVAWAQQAELADQIVRRKEFERQVRTGRTTSPHDARREMELVGRVRMGDRPGARQILNEMLVDILARSAGTLDLMKARLLELLVVLCRAAVQAGASWDEVFSVQLGRYRELDLVDSLESLCTWSVRALDDLMDTIYRTRDGASFEVIGRVMDFLRSHYRENIRIDQVARVVHFSPYYLSRLFKEQVGITIMDCLSEIRLEKARELLESTAVPVRHIAQQVGYGDPGYFSRVFKRMVGLTPNQYRCSCGEGGGRK